jgi:branched-chain amino acid transport system substrate-binding protein
MEREFLYIFLGSLGSNKRGDNMIKKMFLLLVLTLIIFSGCSNSKEEIKIGSILILSGSGAAWGTASMNGIDMALEKINNNGGINGKTLVVDHQDDQSDAKHALSAFQQLTEVKDIDIVIGTTWSHTGLPLKNLAHEKEVLMVSPSLGKAEFNEESDYLFNTWPHDYILSAELADRVYSKGHRRIALIGAEEVWVKEQTNAFKARFEELGGTIEVLVEPVTTNKNVNSEALKIKNANIDAIVSTTDGIMIGTLVVKKVRELGVALPVYCITMDQDVIDAAEGAYEEMEFLTSLTPTEEFKTAYETKYNIPIDIGASSAYDAVMMIAEAMEATNSEDTTVLSEYLNNIKVYDGVSGHLVSDGTGAFTKTFAVKKIVNGKITDLS